MNPSTTTTSCIVVLIFRVCGEKKKNVYDLLLAPDLTAHIELRSILKDRKYGLFSYQSIFFRERLKLFRASEIFISMTRNICFSNKRNE